MRKSLYPAFPIYLRKVDVITRDGISALSLSPEAGSIKSGKVRTVPLHEHLIAQGFLRFVEGHGDGPLFYTADEKAKGDNSIKVKKSRAAQVRHPTVAQAASR
jgi:hypothetical protein